MKSINKVEDIKSRNTLKVSMKEDIEKEVMKTIR